MNTAKVKEVPHDGIEGMASGLSNTTPYEKKVQPRNETLTKKLCPKIGLAAAARWKEVRKTLLPKQSSFVTVP